MKWVMAIFVCILSLFLMAVFYNGGLGFWNMYLGLNFFSYILIFFVLLFLLIRAKSAYTHSQNMPPSLAKTGMQLASILLSNVLAAYVTLILVLTLGPSPRQSSTGLFTYITLSAIRSNIEEYYKKQQRLPTDFTDIILQNRKKHADNDDQYDCVLNPDKTVSISCLRWNGKTTKTMTMTFDPQKSVLND